MTAPRCRSCGTSHGEVVLDLGRQPACDHFPLVTDPLPDPVHPLRLWLCASCGLAQLADDDTSPEEPRGVEPEALVVQARDAVARVAAAGLLQRGASVIEYGSPHGGSWLDELAARGLRIAGADEPADVVLDCFGLMHAADQRAALAERATRLATGGVLLLQYHSLAAVVAGAQWNAVRHGHFAYYSTPALLGMLNAAGLSAISAWRFDLYGGTVLLAAGRGCRPDHSVEDLVRAENAVGVRAPGAVARLQRDASDSAAAMYAFLEQAKAEGRSVLGYGAASRAVVLLNRAGIGTDLLSAIADASPAKHGRRIPGVGIPVVAPAQVLKERPDLALLFVPDLVDEVRRALPQVERRGGRWVVLDPTPRVLDVIVEGAGPLMETSGDGSSGPMDRESGGR